MIPQPPSKIILGAGCGDCVRLDEGADGDGRHRGTGRAGAERVVAYCGMDVGMGASAHTY